MNAADHDAILRRLDMLERRDRRLRIERWLMLAVIGGLVITGPFRRLPAAVSVQLDNGAHFARAAAGRSLAGLRDLLRVHPVLDPQTVAADQEEAFGAHATKRAQRDTAAVAARQPRRADPKPSSMAASRVAATATEPAAGSKRAETSVSARPAVSKKASRHASRSVKLTARRTGAFGPSRSDSSAAFEAAGRSISRDVEKKLMDLPAQEPFRALALADWPDPALAAAASGPAPPASVRAAILPALAPASSSPSAEPAPPSVVATPNRPVTLKALGYAESADGSAQIVLSDGNALYVVNEGQEFLDRFRVVSLRPEGVDIEDRATNQTIHLGFGP